MRCIDDVDLVSCVFSPHRYRPVVNVAEARNGEISDIPLPYPC